MARKFRSALTQYYEYASAIVTAAPFTYSVWFKPDTTTGEENLVTVADSAASNYVDLSTVSGGQVYIETGGGTRATTAGTAFRAREWSHAAASLITASTAAVWLNYARTANKATFSGGATQSGINKFDVAALNSGAIYGPYNGLIDRVGLWKITLSDHDVARLSSGEHARRVRPDSLVAYWEFDENRDTWIEPDLIGGRHLLRKGGASFMPGDQFAQFPIHRRKPIWFLHSAASGVNENASPVTCAASVAAPALTLSYAGTPLTMVGGVAVPTVLLNLAASPIALVAAVVDPALAVNHLASPLTAPASVVAPATTLALADGISPVAAASSVPSQTPVVDPAPSPVTSAGSVVGPTLAMSNAPSPVTEAGSVVTPATTLALADGINPVSAAASVATQTPTIDPAPSPVTAAGSVASIATVLSQAASPAASASSVVAPVAGLTQSPSPITVAAGVAAPSTSLDQAASPVQVVSGTAAPTMALNQAATPTSAAFSVPSVVVSGGGESPSPVTFAAGVASPSTALSQAASPATEAASIASPATALVTAAQTPTSAAASVATATPVVTAAPAAVSAASGVAAPATTLVTACSPVTAAFSVPSVTVSAVQLVAQRLITPLARIRNPTLIPSVRTITPSARTRNPTITENRAMYRCSNKPPGSTEKFAWTLTPLLVGSETVSSYSIAVDAGTVTIASDSRSGAVITAFIAGGTLGETARVRVRAVLSSGRSLDVTFFFEVAALATVIDAKDPSDIDDFTFVMSRTMNSGATISTFGCAVDAGGCTVGTESNTTTQGTSRLSGGTVDTEAQVRAVVVTSDGETLNHTARFQIAQT